MRFSFVLILVAVLTSPTFAGIAVKSEYSYNQEGSVVSFQGSDEIVGDIMRTIELPNATYKFDIVSSAPSFYELKSKAKFEVDIDGRAINGNSGDGWNKTRVTAFSSTQLVDTAFVEGVPGQIGGVVEFLWDVTGASIIDVQPKLQSDAYLIDELFTTSFFNTLEENAIPELLLNDQSQPLGTSVQSVQGNFFEPVVTYVDWLVGEELDVFFELQTSAVLNVQNFDAAGFNAVAASEFSNTAKMMQVNIYDQNGNILPDASLVGQNDFVYNPPSSVPEPSSTVVLIGLMAIFGARRRRS